MKTNILTTSILSLTAITLTVFSLFKNKYEKAMAYNPNRVYIGKMFSYHRVSTTTKVYCTQTTYQYALEAGRTVYDEGGSKGNDPYLESDDDIEIDYSDLGFEPRYNPNNPTVFHYYYATIYEPKLVGCKQMYNDVESLVFAIETIEYDMNYFGYENQQNVILGYIRSYNTTYCTENWDHVAGEIDGSYAYGRRYLTVGGLELREYFASFLDSSVYNLSLHGYVDDQYFYAQLPLVNNSSSDSAEIDLVYMFASSDAIASGSGQALGSLPYSLLNQVTYKSLASWGADLQDATAKASEETNYSNLIFDMEDVFSDSSLSFTYDDYYADVDAINMFWNVNLSSSSLSAISSIIEDYYGYIFGGQLNRETSFVINLVNMVNNYSNNYSNDFREIIYEFLKLNLAGNTLETLDLGHDTIKYYFLCTTHGNLFTIPLNSFRNKMALEFTNYVLTQGGFIL